MLFGDGDERRNIEIPFDRRAAVGGPDQIGLIGLETVQRKAVFIGIDRDGAEAQFRCRPENADGDFASVGNEQFTHS